MKRGFGNKTAIVFYDKNFVKKIYTYNKLSNLVESFSKILQKKINRKKKPTVLIHGSASIETSVSMLVCSKLGFHFSVLFEDLPSKAILLREKILKPKLIISELRMQEIFFNQKSNNFLKKE